MRATDLETYQSPWLTAADLQGRARRLTIAEWTIQEVRQRDGDKVKKIALAFQGAKKRMLLNATQAKILDSAYGELEQWIGKTVILQPARAQSGAATIEVVIIPPAQPKQEEGGSHGASSSNRDNPFEG